MLFKHSIRSLLVLGIVASSASAQSPLWFETPVPAAVPNTSPIAAQETVPGPQQAGWFTHVPWDSKLKAPSRNAASWIERNKVEATLATAGQPIIKSTIELDELSPADKATKEEFSRGPSTTIEWATWSAASETAQHIPAAKQAFNAGKTSAADRFIKPAESRLRTQQAFNVKPVASNQGWIRKGSQAAEGQEVSTQLTPQTLQSGETGSDGHWPSISSSEKQDFSYLSVAGNEAVVAPEDSLILPTGSSLAIWQAEYVAKTMTEQRDREAAASNESEEDIEAKSTETAQADPKKAKFDTGSMVGPLRNTQQLFSMLEVGENFQTYAEQVQSMRTRDLDSQMQAAFTDETYTWISPVFYHKPLYFEQPNLERYGNGTRRCLQPIASSVHFFGTIPLLPYKMLTQHPCEKHYTLGNRRPGNCNPVQRSVILGQSYLGEVRQYWRPGSGY